MIFISILSQVDKRKGEQGREGMEMKTRKNRTKGQVRLFKGKADERIGKEGMAGMEEERRKKKKE